MKDILRFAFFLLIALIILFLAILLGDQGSWYLAWALGTAMIVLLAAGGAIWLDQQESHSRDEENTSDAS